MACCAAARAGIIHERVSRVGCDGVVSGTPPVMPLTQASACGPLASCRQYQALDAILLDRTGVAGEGLGWVGGDWRSRPFGDCKACWQQAIGHHYLVRSTSAPLEELCLQASISPLQGVVFRQHIVTRCVRRGALHRVISMPGRRKSVRSWAMRFCAAATARRPSQASVVRLCLSTRQAASPKQQCWLCISSGCKPCLARRRVDGGWGKSQRTPS